MNQCERSQIVGCQFTLFPMSDHFIEMILSSLDDVDLSKVWQRTDDITTCVRGQMSHVFDVTQALFLQTAKSGEHVAMSGTFSVGCPGDSDADAYMDVSEVLANKENSQQIKQQAGCKLALYPLGVTDYMSDIYQHIQQSEQYHVQVSADHYATRLDGDVKDIFQTLFAAFQSLQNKVPHVTMTFTISANSPSTK